MVNTHAQRIRLTTLILSALKPFAQPTPMMDVVMACVVDTGIPKCAAVIRTVAPVASAAKP